MSNTEGVVPNLTYSIRFPDMERDIVIDPAVDRLVRVQRFACYMLKVVADEDAPLRTYFLTEEAFNALNDNVAEHHPTGGRMDVTDRAYLYEYEYEGMIESRMTDLEDWL